MIKPKVYIYNNLSHFGASYTSATLNTFAKLAGLELVDSMDAANIVFFSAYDYQDAQRLKGVKKRAKNKPVIMGGPQGFFGEPYLAWADYVVVGEGFDFIMTLGKEGFEPAINLPCVLSKNKNAIASYRLPYKVMPMYRKTPRMYYYMGGRGCKNKCKFCTTGWTYPHSVNPYISKAVKKILAMGGTNLTLVINDFSDVPKLKEIKCSQSIRLMEYLKRPDTFHNAMSLKFGVEGWTEEDRRRLGKPIPDEAIKTMFAETSKHKQKCFVFMLIDYPGWKPESVEAFIENILPMELHGQRQIYFKCTHFNPCPHTPLSKIGVPKGPPFFDKAKFFWSASVKNKVLRVLRTQTRGACAWRTVFYRCSHSQAKILGFPDQAKLGGGEDPMNAATGSERSMEKFILYLRERGLEHLLDEQQELICEKRINVRSETQ
jgi:hypothetical protein